MAYRQGYDLNAYRRAGSTSIVPKGGWMDKSVGYAAQLRCQNSLLPYCERCGGIVPRNAGSARIGVQWAESALVEQYA